MKKTLPRFLLVALIGGLAGTLGDFAHFACGVDGYYPGGARLPWLRLPYWVPALFACAALAIAITHYIVRKWAAAIRANQTPGPLASRLLAPAHGRNYPARWLFSGCALFLALYLLSAFIPPEAGPFKDVLLAMSALILWYALDRSAVGAALALASAATGTFAEAELIAHGIFYYLPASVAFAGVPSWLPWLYVGASVAVGGLLRVLKLTD